MTESRALGLKPMIFFFLVNIFKTPPIFLALERDIESSRPIWEAY